MAESPERELNPRLRRADWRFLLPTPRPERAICRGSGRLAEAVASVADRVVTTAQGECDLAVAEDPDLRALAELRDALRPGGACYAEWHSPRGGAATIERTLGEAGFVDIACYRRWPAYGGSPLYWIPLGAPGAADFVRSRGRLRGGRVRRLLAAIPGRLRDLLRGRFAAPIAAVAHRPGGRRSDPAGWLREHWLEWELGPTPDQLSTLLVTGGPRSVSKVVLLAFAEPEPAPLVVIKAARVAQAAAGLRREAAVLGRLAGAPGGPRPGVPRLLFDREVGGTPLVGETAIAGRPLAGLIGPRTLATWSRKVTEWLARLGSGAKPLSASHWREAVVAPVLARFVDRFGEVADPGLIRESEAILRGVADLPPVPEQRDFGPWNLLVAPSGELGVLDWESAEAEGLPALDLLYYLAWATFAADRAHDRDSRVRSYRRTLDPASATGTVRRDCLRRYLGALGLDPGRLAPLRVLVWLIHAESDFGHAAADAGAQPPRAALERSLFLALWTEEVRDLARR